METGFSSWETIILWWSHVLYDLHNYIWTKNFKIPICQCMSTNNVVLKTLFKLILQISKTQFCIVVKNVELPIELAKCRHLWNTTLITIFAPTFGQHELHYLLRTNYVTHIHCLYHHGNGTHWQDYEYHVRESKFGLHTEFYLSLNFFDVALHGTKTRKTIGKSR